MRSTALEVDPREIPQILRSFHRFLLTVENETGQIHVAGPKALRHLLGHAR